MFDPSLDQQRCKAHADLCRCFAASAVDPRTRDYWLRFAKAWERTAAEAVAEETLAETVAEAEKSAAGGEERKSA